MRSATASAANKNLLAVWSGLGSPGRSTVAIALAREISIRLGDTLLVDADCCCNGATSQLDLELVRGGRSCWHLADAASVPDSACFTVQIAKGLDLTPTYGATATQSRFARPRLSGMARLLPGKYTATVVDMPPYVESANSLVCQSRHLVEDDPAEEFLKSSETVVAVCRADPAGIRTFCRAMHVLMTRIRIEESRLLAVVNRLPMRSSTRRSVRIREAISAELGVQVARFLPEDPAVVSALWACRPVNDHAPGSDFVREIGELVTLLESRIIYGDRV